MLTNGNYVLHTLLLVIRAPLTTLRGVEERLVQLQVDISSDTLAWFNKWRPAIHAWILEEARFRTYCYDAQDLTPNWEQIIADLGESLREVTIAQAEAQMLMLPSREDAKNIINMAIEAIDSLYTVYRLIQSQAYKQLQADHD